ncbi:MAG: hypothetical protein P4N60_09610 [Verrucomicrobiae bacterium]|nr:hypothetical protein [Verrucomicrobiae bacterium]
MNRIALSTALTLVVAAPLVLHGQDASESEDLNRFSLGPRFGFNFKGDFRLRSIGNPSNPGPASGGVNHGYNDGYVNVDSSGNAGGQTWNWGYQNNSQVVGDTMQFHSVQAQSPSLASHNNTTDDPQAGLEFVYQRVLGRFSTKAAGCWGLEAGFGYTDIDLHDDRTATGFTTVTTDAYQLNGSLPPGASYHGTFQGPGTLLGDTPTRTTATALTSQTSQQRLSGQLYTIRLGPFAEWNITSQLSLAASAGLTLAPASIDYDYTELNPGVGGSALTSGHSSKVGLLYGGFVGATLRFDFTRHFGAYLGGQFQGLSTLEQTSGTHVARLDPGATVYGTAGLVWKF